MRSLLIVGVCAGCVSIMSCGTRDAISETHPEGRSTNRTSKVAATTSDTVVIAVPSDVGPPESPFDEQLPQHEDHAKHHGAAHQHDRWNHGHESAPHGHSLNDAAHAGQRIAIGEKVPEFEVTIHGKQWRLSDLRKNAALTVDGTLVLTFWCSFCHSCRDVEHPLDELAKKYRGRVGVVALDASAGETAEHVAEFARERQLTLPIALDSTGSAADLFGASVTTTTVVIDNRGVLRYRGQFREPGHEFAAEALRAVLSGGEVSLPETPQRG